MAKTVALAAVVVGHTSFLGAPKSLVDFCFSFHMPLFFIISGYFVKTVHLDKGFVWKNARALLLPYAITCLIVIVSTTIQSLLIGTSPIDTATRWILASLYGSGQSTFGMPFGIIPIGAVWYLWALFWSKLLLMAARETGCPLIVCILLFVIGVSTKEGIWLPFSIQPALCATLFLYVGQCIRTHSLLEKRAINPLLWVCMLLTWAYCAIFYGQLYMVENTYAHGAIDVVGSICGALCILKGCQIISIYIPSICHAFAFIGRNTLPLFCMHLVTLNYVLWSDFSIWIEGIGIPVWIAAICLHAVSMSVLSFVLYFLPRPISSCFFVSRK